MKVNEVIAQLQNMIANGEITGSEPFGSFEYSCEEGVYFIESVSICKDYSEDNKSDIVYI